MRKRKIWTRGGAISHLLIPPGGLLGLLFIWPLATVVYQALFEPSFGVAKLRHHPGQRDPYPGPALHLRARG